MYGKVLVVVVVVVAVAAVIFGTLVAIIGL